MRRESKMQDLFKKRHSMAAANQIYFGADTNTDKEPTNPTANRIL